MNPTATENQKQPILFLEDLPYDDKEVMDALKLNKQLPIVVKELTLNHILKDIKLDQDLEDRTLLEYRSQNNLLQDESYFNHLMINHLDEILLKRKLCTPHKIVKYREERWGPLANSLYLKHKEKYDQITYHRLESSDNDVMQEVFFRLKDREDSWKSMARQFPNAQADARIGPIPIQKVEAPLIQALRQSGLGKVIRPITIGNKVIVAELERFETSQFNDELRTRIIRDEFNQWFQTQCSKMLKSMRFPT